MMQKLSTLNIISNTNYQKQLKLKRMQLKDFQHWNITILNSRFANFFARFTHQIFLMSETSERICITTPSMTKWCRKSMSFYPEIFTFEKHRDSNTKRNNFYTSFRKKHRESTIFFFCLRDVSNGRWHCHFRLILRDTII